MCTLPGFPGGRNGRRAAARQTAGSKGQGGQFRREAGSGENAYHDEAIFRHLLAGIQFILGDLEADAAPSATPKETSGAAEKELGRRSEERGESD